MNQFLLRSDHPKIKLFITQGGLQSTDEAINAGVPLIGVPMLADQWYNVEHYVHHGVGLQLDIRTVNTEVVKNAIETVIGDPRQVVVLRHSLRILNIIDKLFFW